MTNANPDGLTDVASLRAALDEAIARLASANAELDRRQSFTDALLETIEVGIVSCDAAGENWVRNRSEREMLGLPPTAARERTPDDAALRMDVLDPSGRRLNVEDYPLLRALRGEVPGDVELLLGPAGGPHREVISRNSQIVAADGVVLGAVSALTDVSAERASARALAVEHQRLTEAQRLGQLGSFEYDYASAEWSYSDQLCVLWGVESAGLVPETTQALIVEDDQPLAWESWREAARIGGRHSYEYRIRRGNDGAERVIRSSVEVEVDTDGQPVRSRGTHLDITEITAAQQAAQRANAFFEAVLTASPDFTFVTDLATGASIYGSRGKAVLGITAEDMLALGAEAITVLVHPEDQHRLRTANIDAADLDDGQVVQLRYRGLHADGQWHWLSRRVTPFRRDSSGAVVEVLGVMRDITDVMEAEDRLTHAALHDNLTGLPNRALLVDRLAAAVARSGRDGREVAILFCDLDSFKRVNDTAGHAAGDAVLMEVAQRLTAVLRDEDTVARVGGDEFVIIVEPWERTGAGEHAPSNLPGELADRTLAVRVAERVAGALREPIIVNGVEHVVTASIGITYATSSPNGRAGTITADQALQDADAAMYRAKGRGKDRFEIFEDGLRIDQAERGRVEQVLRRALRQSTGAVLIPCSGVAEFTAAYQPIFDSDTGGLVGFEALARLTDNNGVSIPPDVFIAVAETTGAIRPLGVVMLDLACGQLAAWRAQVPGLEHVSMAVNVSALQAQHHSLGADVRHALTAHGLAARDLVLELTETALLQAERSTITALRSLHAEGVGIAIDDFGTGYASLRYLATLPVTAVKIDRSFTNGLPHDETSRKIVKAVAGLAADLDLACIVEGVESREQLVALPAGVQLQGYHTGRPQPPHLLDLLNLVTLGRR